MKASLTLLCTAAVALLSYATLAQAQVAQAQVPQSQTCARIEVQDLRPAQGMLMLAAYSDSASFRKTAVSQAQLPATAETMQVQLCGLSGSVVAVTLFQDLNSNGKLDANLFGMPTEPWGASGKISAMSAPTWDSAQVPLDANPIVIKLSR